MEILDRQAATLNYQLSEIAHLLEDRLGESSELAKDARRVQKSVEILAHQIHRHKTLAGGNQLSAGQANTA